MNKTLLILRNEIVTTVTRRSFLLIAVGVPLLIMLVTLLIWFVKRPEAVATGDSTSRPQTAQVEGYVDHSGIIKQLPPDVSPSKLLHYDDEQAANRGLDQGTIEAYYVVPSDYVATGKLFYVHPKASLTTNPTTVWVIQWTLLVNMLGGDAERAAHIWNPMLLKATALAPDVARSRSEGEGLFMLPYIVVFAFYIVVLMAGGLLRNSMGDERKNRVQEILLTCANPIQFLAGKIAALGIVGLLQMLLWASIGYVSLRIMGQTDILPADFRLPPAIIAWTAIFFLLGYAVYGSLLGGLGALTGPNTPGSSSADFVVIWPTVIPLVLWGPIVDYPSSALAIVLSLFPLTSPIAMLMRLIMGGVPAWQLALSIALLIATAYLVVRGVAATFRAQNLLTGQPFSLRGYVAMMLGRA
jgi:ABC-2 type transport system permease protein